MGDSATIAKWGNSKAVRIPAPVLRSAGLDLYDRVTFSISDEGILLRKCLSKAISYRDFRGVISKNELNVIENALLDTERVDVDEW
jgi:antitoxin component of MazEF toxin-antitoxin module